MNTTPSFPTALRRLVLAAAVGCLAPVLPAQANGTGWFAGDHVQGNGSIRKQAREVGHFAGVAMGLSGTVEVHIAPTESITVETDENLLPLIETVVDDGVLRIRPTKKHMDLQAHTLKVIVNAKELNSVALGGTGTVEADALRGKHVEVNLGGSGTINVKGIESEDVSVTIGGSGNLKVGGGTTNSLSIRIGGSGDVNAGALKANEVNVKVGGSGQSTVWAVDSLSFTIAGSGDVNYYGDPRISKTVFGSGSVKRLGPAPR